MYDKLKFNVTIFFKAIIKTILVFYVMSRPKNYFQMIK